MSAPASIVRRRAPAPPAPPPAPELTPPVAVPVPAAPAAELQRNWLLSLSVVVVGMFMAVLDSSIVNVAIPHIQTQFGASNDDVQWVVTAYTLSMGVVVPVSGWLGDRFGLRTIYNIALVLFIIGSALCGVAWGMGILIAFRIFQAVGGGLLPAISMAMVYRIAPRERIGMAMGLYGLGIVFAPAIGPTLGGYLVEYVDWRLIFYINVPIGILGLMAAIAVLPRFGTPGTQRLDYLGFGTICSSLFSLLLALSEGASWGWTSYRVLGLLALSVLMLAIFIVVELSIEHPMLDVRLFRYWAFTNSTILVGIMMAGFYAGFFYVPLFIQEGQGIGAFLTGLTLLPSAIVTAVLMPISGRLYDRFGARWPAAIGLIITAYGTYLFHDLGPDTTREQVVVWMCIRSFGMGLAMMPIMTGMMAIVPTAKVARASAMSNIIQRSSAALGLGILTSVLTSQQAQQLAGRAALLPAVSPGSTSVQSVANGGQQGMIGFMQGLNAWVFGGAIDDLFLLTAGITAVAVLMALMLPQASSRRRGGGPPPAE